MSHKGENFFVILGLTIIVDDTNLIHEPWWWSHRFELHFLRHPDSREYLWLAKSVRNQTKAQLEAANRWKSQDRLFSQLGLISAHKLLRFLSYSSMVPQENNNFCYYDIRICNSRLQSEKIDRNTKQLWMESLGPMVSELKYGYTSQSCITRFEAALE